jgi:hypothetical protein
MTDTVRPRRPAAPGRYARIILLAVLGLAASASPALAQADAGWTGNMARNPGFEEDFVNANAEGHVLSFKGDWYYNQKDLIPDYWDLKGDWIWSRQTPHAGTYALRLGKGATASQTFQRAVIQEGGGAWGGSVLRPIPMPEADKARFGQPWRVKVWCRGGGSVTLTCGKKVVTASTKPGGQWQEVTAELPAADTLPPEAPVVLTLHGPGEFDDVVVQEKLSSAPNLAPNSSFERLDKDGRFAGWARYGKYRAIGPTYYVWTDWNHFFSANRGPVGPDRLVAHIGQQALRMDVYPGDEKYVESDLIVLNQDKARAIEVGAYVRADKINLIDVRCVDEEGVYMPAYRARQPEYTQGGTFLFGNGTFGWRYVRKFFGTPQGRPVKGIRVRLCARGMNGHTLDDAGTRPYVMATGTVWWDDVRVTERTSDAAALQARGVKVPAPEQPAPGPLVDGAVNLGQRFYGENALAYSFTNGGTPATFQMRLTTQMPGDKPATTTSAAVRLEKGKQTTLQASYTLSHLVGELDKQGRFKVELLRDGKPLAAAAYAFNTWPVVVDVDVSRHYNLPAENPVTVALNLGVADATLDRVKKLELQLYRPSDRKVLATQTITDLKDAFAKTLAALPKKKEQSYEFTMPTPAWWADRTNLIVTKIDLTPLKVWPHDQPTRDTLLVVRGLDAGGKELFRDGSAPFGRMEAPPAQPAIQSVAVRADGVVLINGAPRYLTGATHQSNRVQHTVPLIAQLGLMGHRLTQAMTFAQIREMWEKYRLYSLQLRPANKIDGTAPILDLTPKQREELEAFVKSGGMQNVVSVNTGGWEANVDYDDPAKVARHLALNAWVRKVTNRPLAISTSGAYNAWWIPKLPFYDINFAETEMWGPMDFNVIFTPYMKRLRKEPTAWVYLPQLYDNTPFERYRFETYENLIRGSAGVAMIQGIGDPTFNRGLAGELRYLETRLTSLEKPPAVTLDPPISHKVARHKGTTYVLATNAGPIQLGEWRWNADVKFSGRASHEGDSINAMWRRPGGVRIHGFRGLPMPELIRKGDRIVQYVWLDPKERPDWVMLAVRGDGKVTHNVTLGNFDFAKFRAAYGNVLMYSELNHSVWHDINYVMDDATYARAVKVLGKKEADQIKKAADAGRAKVDKVAYQAAHFHSLGPLPAAGRWHRIEIDAEKVGLVGKLVDGFAYLTRNGRALWDFTALERGGKVARVFCEDSVGIDRTLLKAVRVNVPGLKKGTRVRVLFEDREIVTDDGGFTDNFEGTDTYGREAGGVAGDLFGFVKDEDRELARMLPSGYGYTYGLTAVHIYAVEHAAEAALLSPVGRRAYINRTARTPQPITLFSGGDYSWPTAATFSRPPPRAPRPSR